MRPAKFERPEDYVVEVRTKTLARVGVIPPSDLRVKYQPVFNGVGSWILTLPAEHRMVPFLRTAGSGIVITNVKTGIVEMSGPTSKPTKKATAADATGMVSIAGLSDNRLAFDTRAWPTPSVFDVGAQTTSHDVRTGVGSTIMRAYVDANIGPMAPIARRPAGTLRAGITIGADPALGLITTQRARFDNLGELLNKIGIESGNLGWRIIQVGNVLEFQVYQPSDRTALIRLDLGNGTLSETNVEFAPPDVTRPIVAGQGEGVKRKFIAVTDPGTNADEALWGLIIEDFKDQRNTDDTQELIDSGLAMLDEGGRTKVAVKAIPTNEQTMVYMQDFFLGDQVSVVIDGQEQPNSHITEAAKVIEDGRVRTAIAIGDVADFNSDSALRQTVDRTIQRVDQLERNSETPSLIIEVNDWNKADKPGRYWSAYTGSGAGQFAVNAPFIEAWMGDVFEHPQLGRLIQVIRTPRANSFGTTSWSRVRSDTGAWFEWQKDNGNLARVMNIGGGTTKYPNGRIRLNAAGGSWFFNNAFSYIPAFQYKITYSWYSDTVHLPYFRFLTGGNGSNTQVSDSNYVQSILDPNGHSAPTTTQWELGRGKANGWEGELYVSFPQTATHNGGPTSGQPLTQTQKRGRGHAYMYPGSQAHFGGAINNHDNELFNGFVMWLSDSAVIAPGSESFITVDVVVAA